MQLTINTTRDFLKSVPNCTRLGMQFWNIFQKSLVVIIVNCTHSSVIMYISNKKLQCEGCTTKKNPQNIGNCLETKFCLHECAFLA
jgi:hypothetical protein